MAQPRSNISGRAEAVAVLAALVVPALITWVYFVALAESPAWSQQTAYTIGKVIQFGFPAAWVLLIARHRPRWRWPRSAELIEGAIFGAAVFATALAAYHGWLKPGGYLGSAGQAVVQKVTRFGIEGLGAFVALGVFYSVVHAFLEEYYWRWFVFGRLEGLVGYGKAALVSSLGFTAHHVLVLSVYFGWLSWATLLFSLAVTIGGLAWAWMLHRHGSLWGPWLSHLAIDAAIFVVGYDLACTACGF